MATLKTNYKDDMFSGDRKYREIRNSDGTVSFEDVTVYSQTGDVFASADINATNAEVNAVNQNLTEKIEQKSGSLSDGTDTYTGINLDFISYDATAKKLLLHEKGTGADAVIPFSGELVLKRMVWGVGVPGNGSLMCIDENGNNHTSGTDSIVTAYSQSTVTISAGYRIIGTYITGGTQHIVNEELTESKYISCSAYTGLLNYCIFVFE